MSTLESFDNCGTLYARQFLAHGRDEHSQKCAVCKAARNAAAQHTAVALEMLPISTVLCSRLREYPVGILPAVDC